MKSTEVCVDASLAIKVVVPETGSDKADALFPRWAGEEVQLIAPVFFESRPMVFFDKRHHCVEN
jgi:predicted nucleic acid-binding protein